eukprot:scaffold4449_cov105-Cylindrotheca_fusiformis.AAC.1
MHALVLQCIVSAECRACRDRQFTGRGTYRKSLWGSSWKLSSSKGTAFGLELAFAAAGWGFGIGTWGHRVGVAFLGGFGSRVGAGGPSLVGGAGLAGGIGTPQSTSGSARGGA